MLHFSTVEIWLFFILSLILIVSMYTYEEKTHFKELKCLLLHLLRFLKQIHLFFYLDKQFKIFLKSKIFYVERNILVFI